MRLCENKSLAHVFNTRQLSIYQSRTVLANKSMKMYSFMHRPVRCCLFDFVSRHAMLMNSNYMLPSDEVNLALWPYRRSITST